ncbi:MAG: hypothetical protein HY272_10350 [Gammaproteobacteria bacterium]|nr:hypothetical protein [Gammaproteobacteria bacterium]
MKHAEMTTTQFKLNTLARALRVAAISAGMVWSAGAGAAEMCSIGDGGIVNSTSNTPSNFAGVTLNKTLTLLNQVNNIRGATYDPVKGEVVFVGEGAVQGVIDMDDLVVAINSVFAMNQDPGITFYTADTARAYQTGLWDVTYFGATRNRNFGQILFEADYLLKQLSLGIAENGALLQTAYPGLPSDYKGFAERMFKDNLTLQDNSGNALSVEFWFAPKAVTLAKTDATEGSQSFVFREADIVGRVSVA